MNAVRASKPKATAFTIVELVAVLVMIVLWVALVTPTLNRSGDQARAIYCLGNQNAIAKGLMGYAAEWSEYPMNYRSWDASSPGVPRRFALECLSKYVGGPKGRTDPATGAVIESDLTGLPVGGFPKAYICPCVDKANVFKANAGTLYHASYWTNPAVRCNRGFNQDNLAGNGSPGQTAGDDNPDSPRHVSGVARFMTYCPNAPSKPPEGAHWRSFYYPRPDAVKNPQGTCFTGDTNNEPYESPSGQYDTAPGAWMIQPGKGSIIGSMGFDRHGGRIMTLALDGHGTVITRDELDKQETYARFTDGTPSCDFMVQTVGDDGCGGSRVHKLPDPACE